MTKGTKLSDLNYEIGGLILPSSKETDYKNLLYTQANDFQPETLKRRNKAGSGLRTDRFINIENSETPFDFDGTSLGAANKIELCQKAYYNFGLLRNTIDIMSELANSQIFIEKGDKNTRHLVKNWLKAINIWKVKDQFFREYFRSGNVFFYSFKGKIDINSSNKLKEIYGKEIEDIPLRYILLNPADIRVTASSSFVEADYHKVLNYYELSRLRHPKTEIDKKTFESLPKEIQEQIQTEMVPYLRLEPSNLNVIFYKKQDYEPFAIPFAWPVLEDINAKIELKRIDMAVARTAERALLLITAGAKEEDGGVNPKTISQLQSLFSSESVIRTLIADYTVKGQWILPDLNKILTEEKYKQIDKDIATALNALFFNSEEKFANINIKVQVFIERLNEARNAFLEEFLNPEIENLCKKVRAQNVPVIKFENISLKDEVQYIRVFTRMAELGIITPDQLMEAIDNGRLPSTSEQIEEGQQKFIEQKEKGYFRPLISGNVGNEGGRPAGTDGVPQTTKNISPLGGGQSNANIHQSDLNKSILLYNKILNSLETIAKEKFSVDNFDNNQEEMISLAARSILVNNGNNYKDVVNKYFDDPKFISEKNQLEIDELMLEHNINETQACILYYAKKN
ncbi:MAG: hypothetical protein HC836_12690 [Richelia sp. RM2_1_2]|nr:hypothetical protein [Richelia sp. RM2_1_2]